MNLINLSIPKKCPEMIETFENYYDRFYIEMLRMSNNSLQDYIEKYINMLTSLCKTPHNTNLIRVAIGVVSLHTFGYNNFLQLSMLFDRVIPQIDIECVRFTSWCAGNLIHHPREDQAKYAAHLFERAIGWIRAKGRRSRPLAAVNLLNEISRNAGYTTVLFLPRLKSAGWELVSHPSLQVLNDTAKCLRSFTLALMRYGRSEIKRYLKFYYHLCKMILPCPNPVRQYAALILLRNFMEIYPDFFVPKMQPIWQSVINAYENSYENILIQCAAFCTSVAFVFVDPKFFVDNVADDVIKQAKALILEFEKDVVKSLIIMIEKVPSYMKEQINELKEMIILLFKNELYDESLNLFCACINHFKDDICKDEKIISLVEMEIYSPLTEAYIEFFASFFKIPNFSMDQFKQPLLKRFSEELNGNNQLEVLKLLAILPSSALEEAQFLYEKVAQLSTNKIIKVRSIVPQVLYNIAISTKAVQFNELFIFLIRFATFEENINVRRSCLEVLYQHCSMDMAKPQYLDILKIFLNDDSNSIRQTSLRLMAKLKEYNPAYVTSIIRHFILDFFFILKQVSSIRQRSRTAVLLPDLIRASSNSVPTYSETFLQILIKTYQDQQSAKYSNFVEETASTTILIGLTDSLAVLAPFDPEKVSKYINQIIPLLCAYLIPTEQRNLISSILKAFLVLLSAPCSNVEIRTKVPVILSACSNLLANTRSRAIRKFILRVIGAIGVIEVRQKPIEKIAQTPENLDEDLARQFYHPNRDTDGIIDETMLLNPLEKENYYTAVVASSLLNIFKDNTLVDFHYDVAQALVSVLSYPKISLLPYFDSFVATLLDVLENSSIDEMKLYLPLYSELVESSTNNTIPFVKRTLQLINTNFFGELMFCDELMIDFFNVIKSFLNALGSSFAEFSSEPVCLLVVVLDSWKTLKEDICVKVLELLSILATFAVDYHYLIIPQICNAIDCQQSIVNVRVKALDSLKTIVLKTDVELYFGPIFRSLSYALTLVHEETKKAAKELLFALHKKGASFINTNDEDTLNGLWTVPLESPEVREVLLNSCEISRSPQNQIGIRKDQKIFSEDSIIARLNAPNLGVGKHAEDWLLAFIGALISSSPNKHIRACSNVASIYKPFASDIVTIAFHSCWEKMSNNAKEIITSSFVELLNAKENYESVAREIFKILFFMHKVGKPLSIPFQNIVGPSKRYGAVPFALKLWQEQFDEFQEQQKQSECNSFDRSFLSQLIDIFIQIGNWTNATASWKMFSDSGIANDKLFEQLKMWDRAAVKYHKAFQRNQGDPDIFKSLIHSLSELERWDDVISYLSIFNSHKREIKHEISLYFAEAALQLGRWDDLNNILSYTPMDSLHSSIINAINALHNGNWKKVTKYIDNGFVILASQPIRIFSDQQRIHRDTMYAAQKLIEINETMQWMQSNDEIKKQDLQNVWKTRLKTAPHDFELWFNLLSERIQLTQLRDENLIDMFQMRSVSLGTKLHSNAFKILFPNFSFTNSPNIDCLCYTITKWYMGEQKDALDLLEQLLNRVDGKMKQKCVYFYSDWAIEMDESNDSYKKVYGRLKEVLEISEDSHHARIIEKTSYHHDKSPSLSPHNQRYKTSLALPNHVIKNLEAGGITEKLFKKWATINASLISTDEKNLETYVTNAIQALVECCCHAPSFPDLVQLLHIFFEHATKSNIFDNTASTVSEKIPPSLLLEAAPQLLVQLAHPAKNVSELVHKLIMEMLHVHYHSLIFSVIVLTFSENTSRSRAASQILAEFQNQYPKIYSEICLIRDSLNIAAVTWYETALWKVKDALSCFESEQFDAGEDVLIDLLNEFKNPRCQMHNQFLEMYQKEFYELDNYISISSSHPNDISINANDSVLISKEDDFNIYKEHFERLKKWCQTNCPLFASEVDRVQMIQLSSISAELAEKQDFFLAVPGTYKPDKPLIRINYFVEQFGVYMPKQQPKDVVIKGEDGLFYQYLLEDHEDIRLDERIMQFFRLINSFLKKESVFASNHIQTMHVIPLSRKNGLIQWIPGTDTLRSIVTQYRNLYHRDPLEEINLLQKYGYDRYDAFLPIQKTELLLKIFDQIPDTDLANFLWVKASTVDIWHKQTETFAITSAMTSIVGYIIGLGDRNPSNILIDRYSGKVIHIDFSNCFESASKRLSFPESIPFRLTRMMIKAMGITGIHGTFKTTFINMSALLRDNRNVLMMVLSIFVHEPLSDLVSDDKSKSIVDSPIGRSFSSTFSLSAFDDGKIRYNDYSKEAFVSSIEARRRIKEKLRGSDFEEGDVLSVEEQADRLISMATDSYNLAKMHHGWFPFW